MARESILAQGAPPAGLETPHNSTLAGISKSPTEVLSPEDVTVEIASVEDADDMAIVSALTDIVNEAFTQMEGGFFQEHYLRTNNAEIAKFIRQGNLAVAYLNSPPPSAELHTSKTPKPPQNPFSTSRQPIGCVRAACLTPSLGHFGMLAVSPHHHGAGLGRRLVLFSEEHCAALGCSTMQLELLVPVDHEHAGKARMQAWYRRLGYQLVKLGNFRDEYPDIAGLLRGEAEYRIFEKPL